MKIGDASSCPLANALKLKQKNELVRVRVGVTVAGDYFTLQNPNWVDKFVCKIDNLSDEKKNVTAKEVLDVLISVEKCKS